MKAEDKHRGLTAEWLRELLSYSPDTGEFRWRVSLGTARAGSVAGTRQNKGYWCIKISGRAYLAHRLVWLYVHGKWPDEQIDHRNGVRDDNRIANLREATDSQNKQNRHQARVGTKTGLLGTSWCERDKRFVATIWVGGKNTRIGGYHTAEEAHAAYLEAKRKFHSHCTL